MASILCLSMLIHSDFTHILQGYFIGTAGYHTIALENRWLVLESHICELGELGYHWSKQWLNNRRIGDKPFPVPAMAYSQLNPWKQTAMKFEPKKFLSKLELENVVCKIATI